MDEARVAAADRHPRPSNSSRPRPADDEEERTVVAGAARARRARRGTPVRRRRRGGRSAPGASGGGQPDDGGLDGETAPWARRAPRRRAPAPCGERLEELVRRRPSVPGSHTRSRCRGEPHPQRQLEEARPVLDDVAGPVEDGGGVLCERLGEAVLEPPGVVGSLERHRRRDHVVREARRLGRERIERHEQLDAPNASTKRALVGERRRRVAAATTSARTRSSPGSRISSGRLADGSSPMIAPTPVRLRKPRSHVRVGGDRCTRRLRRRQHAGRRAVTRAREATAHHVQRVHEVLGDVRMRAHVGPGARLRHAARAASRTARRLDDQVAVTPVMPLAASGVIGATAARSASRSSTRGRRTPVSCRPSARIMRSSAANSAASVPGTSCRWRSACAATSVRRGSTTIRRRPRAPRLLEPPQAVVHREAGELAGLHGHQRVGAHQHPDVGVLEALAARGPAAQALDGHPLGRLVDRHRREALVRTTTRSHAPANGR